MRKATIFLMALALVLTTAAATAPGLRRSRFLTSKSPSSPPLSFFNCDKNTPAVCKQPGSPGDTCCHGKCVDIQFAWAHCGHCDHSCAYGNTCCHGKCVDTNTDAKNCGVCGVKCRTKCTGGYCDYAA